MQHPLDLSDCDGLVFDNGYATQSDQTQQLTQIASQQADVQTAMDSHLWGFLIPCSPEIRRVDFSRLRPTYQVGRNANPAFENDLILPGMKISEYEPLSRWRVSCGVLFEGVRCRRPQRIALSH